MQHPRSVRRNAVTKGVFCCAKDAEAAEGVILELITPPSCSFKSPTKYQVFIVFTEIKLIRKFVLVKPPILKRRVMLRLITDRLNGTDLHQVAGIVAYGRAGTVKIIENRQLTEYRLSPLNSTHCPLLLISSRRKVAMAEQLSGWRAISIWKGSILMLYFTLCTVYLMNTKRRIGRILERFWAATNTHWL
jgi:hypothetical protein